MPKVKAGPVVADRLKSFIERIERLIEERKAIQGDIKDVFAEAKGVGYDVATMRKVIALRAMDVADRDEMETLIDVYMLALGDAKRAAVEAMQKGAGTREAARAAGIAVGAASQLRTGVHGIANGERVHETQSGERDREVDSISDDAGHRSEPSAPADMGNPMSVNADPPLGQQPNIETSQGEQSGTDIFAESANNESCGEPVGALGANALAPSCGLGTAPLRPHDTEAGEFSEIHRGAMQPKGCAKVVRADSSMSESVAASGDAIRDASAMPLDVVAAPHSEGREHAGSAATAPPACAAPPATPLAHRMLGTFVETRGEARPNPDGLDIPLFLRSPSMGVGNG